MQLQFAMDQKVATIGGVQFGGQPGAHPTVVCSSIFQKGDKIFNGKRGDGFDEQQAALLLTAQDRLSRETGVPGMADIVANSGEEFRRYIDFVVSVSDMPFCVDAWQLRPKLEGAAYCAEKGLLDRMFYNSLTVWQDDLETELRELKDIGVKHLLLVAFDATDQMPSGRVNGTEKLLAAIDRVDARFETIFVDTSVMNGPATAFCGIANKLIKERWGFPTASAPSNGSYMWKKAREMFGFKGWSAADAALEALAAFTYHDMVFAGPMAGAPRIFPAIAMADAFLATTVFNDTRALPATPGHPLYQLFPEFVTQLQTVNSAQ